MNTPTIATTRIDMVETAVGCAGNCISCGAYQHDDVLRATAEEMVSDTGGSEAEIRRAYLALKRDQLVVREVPADVLRVNVQRAHDLGLKFNRVVTTDVNTEPLGTPNILELARLLNVAVISHGVSHQVAKTVDTLREVVKMMQTGEIPFFGLTLDYARSQGRLPDDLTYDLYRRTLEELLPAVGSARIAISVQGGDDPDKPAFIGKSEELLRLLEEGTKFPFGLVHIDRGHVYTTVGRGSELVEGRRDCKIIFDEEFVAEELDTWHTYRGKLTADGRVRVQLHDPANTYGTSVDFESWAEYPVEP
ncbi:hypothetical protein HOD30_05545 [Candidatus Peregrinibacteria bacterium]|jgi:hypothetical protein|nr:hypothetical protein [Candidatus Peregrinibacteria bacterium]MBT4631486.1 hypothetical protein [Candidatus Peregrinibacteria bacterium]MBT5516592.1 hypothetical protein [Candidatus Peregrinibacteria bacterium]MBT5823875.1 hypothetical protein [Candidatus Peregrinibacteria bacterium]